MPKIIHPIIADLFVNDQTPGRPVEFTWRLIRRKQRPFLLLPLSDMSLRVSLELYSAQRRRAKIWRACLPLLLKTPAAAFFHRATFSADTGAEIIHFLAEQSGVPAEQLRAPAIKFGGLASHKSRLVLLVCDQTDRPVKVIKLGLNAEGRAATEREADLLEKLPANKIGCIRMTGRLTTSKISAFATAYYPGGSPLDDAGLETLFHSWLNPEPAAPIEKLIAWRELETKVAGAEPAAWPVLRAALAGKNVCSTLHHGDFAPWNIRAINSQNLQAFDWERGSLHGVPGWDWFHFVVQTSILARRHSVERVAAEVEELLQSPRFEKYAAAAGISQIVQPLLLAYLLHHRWVVMPLDGGNRTAELHELLAARWGFTAESQKSGEENSAGVRHPGLLADARQQLKSASSQLANVFWEPELTATVQSTFSAQFLARWPMALLGGLWLAAVTGVHYLYLTHRMLLPLYAIPSLLVAWKMGRRWGTLFAVVTAFLGPVVATVKDPGTHPLDTVVWNTAMRFIILQMCVFLTDRIRRQKDFFRQLKTPNRRPVNLAESWAVVLASGLLFLLIACGVFCTGPRVSFLPLYLFPAILITLFLNLGWGAVMAALGALIASTDEYLSKYNAHAAQVFGWNFAMRFLILFLVIWLLDRLRQENVLFTSRKSNGKSNGAKHD